MSAEFAENIIPEQDDDESPSWKVVLAPTPDVDVHPPLEVRQVAPSNMVQAPAPELKAEPSLSKLICAAWEGKTEDALAAAQAVFDLGDPSSIFVNALECAAANCEDETLEALAAYFSEVAPETFGLDPDLEDHCSTVKLKGKRIERALRACAKWGSSAGWKILSSRVPRVEEVYDAAVYSALKHQNFDVLPVILANVEYPLHVASLAVCAVPNFDVACRFYDSFPPVDCANAIAAYLLLQACKLVDEDFALCALERWFAAGADYNWGEGTLVAAAVEAAKQGLDRALGPIYAMVVHETGSVFVRLLNDYCHTGAAKVLALNPKIDDLGWFGSDAAKACLPLYRDIAAWVDSQAASVASSHKAPDYQNVSEGLSGIVSDFYSHSLSSSMIINDEVAEYLLALAPRWIPSPQILRQAYINAFWGSKARNYYTLAKLIFDADPPHIEVYCGPKEALPPDKAWRDQYKRIHGGWFAKMIAIAGLREIAEDACSRVSLGAAEYGVGLREAITRGNVALCRFFIAKIGAGERPSPQDLSADLAKYAGPNARLVFDSETGKLLNLKQKDPQHALAKSNSLIEICVELCVAGYIGQEEAITALGLANIEGFPCWARAVLAPERGAIYLRRQCAPGAER